MLVFVKSDECKVLFMFEWVGDELLNDFVEKIVFGNEGVWWMFVLIFCFNCEGCWLVVE